MPANSPKEIPALLAAAMNAGDLDAFVELHEHDATTVVPPDGKLVTGRTEIRAALEPIFTTRPKLQNKLIGKLEHDGLALTHTRWVLEGTDPEGRVVELAGRGAIVARRQSDGNWLIALENTMSPER
jgi:uncharacterized protein (TIGR02246 family)